jgi:signal-transduction protein with cAMP-binding, CBS, and nucleotidyltransferase domain
MNEIKYLPVSEVMKTNITKIDGLASVSDALQLMRDNGNGSLIVDKHNEHDEYGLISIGDLATKVIAPDFAPDRMSAYQIMTKPVLTVEHDMNVRYAIRLLTNFKINRALVVENGSSVGMVSLRDMILKYTEQD